jgi:hypothetical protein
MVFEKKIVTASVNSTLDFLLEAMCETVQLTDTQFKSAAEHYQSVAKWLADPKSPLAIYKPWIYPQGSARLKTTVKPIIWQEHDLDLILHLDLPYGTFGEPKSVFDLVSGRLREHDFFRDNMEHYKRCIRITYESKFHLDITPARRDLSYGGNYILVPDRKIKEWKESNPIDYADEWFEEQTLLSVSTKTAAMRSIESLPEQESVRQKAPLRRAVQLIKRGRDCHFKCHPDAPRSIVLTTLAGTHYHGEELVSDAILAILNGIIGQIESEGVIEVFNPVNANERFCEAWASNAEAYQKFVDYVYRFREKLLRLLAMRGLENIAGGLDELFGDTLTKQAVASYAKKFQQDRQDGHVYFSGAKVALATTPSLVTPNRTIPRNNFYGS